MNYYAIIVAGGTGSRMGGDLPKQFIELQGKPVIVHTLEKFFQFQDTIKVVIAIHPKMQDYLNEIPLADFPGKIIEVVHGGETRFQSVKNALAVISDDDSVIGIHDAARPLVSIGTLERCYSAAEFQGNACPVVEISDSLRQITNENSVAVDRSVFRIVQTPQCFKVNVIKKAFLQDYHNSFTDDATVAQSAGEQIFLVEGNRENIKLTYPKDIQLAELLLKNPI